MRLCAALDRAGVHPHFPDPIQIERNAGIPEQRPPGEHGNRAVAVRLVTRDVPATVRWSIVCDVSRLVVFDRH